MVVHDGVIVAGHGRAQAGAVGGVGDRVVAPDADAAAGADVADNQIATNAGWNDQMLAAELATLKEEAFDLDLLGLTRPNDQLASAGCGPYGSRTRRGGASDAKILETMSAPSWPISPKCAQNFDDVLWTVYSASRAQTNSAKSGAKRSSPIHCSRFPNGRTHIAI